MDLLSEKLDKIHLGDCVQGLQNLPEGAVDLAFADPPFNIGYAYDQYDDRRREEEYLAWCKQWINEVHRVLKSDGTFWLAIGDEYAAELKVLAKSIGFRLRNWVIWYYTFGVHCKSKFTRSHAHLLYFVKSDSGFTFNRDAIAVPSARQLVYADKRANPKGRVPDDTWILRPHDIPESFQPDNDTWYIPRINGTFDERMGFHGCQMPEQLLGRIIRATSNVGEIVLDPFSGSATTAAVAKKLGRKFITFELSSDYAAKGNERLGNVKVGDPLAGTENPLQTSSKSSPVKRKSKRSQPTLSMLDFDDPK